MALFLFAFMLVTHADPRLETIEQLRQDKYFRSATCREIANAFLKDYGLPVLGASGAPTKRGDFNRAGDGGDLPTFSDSRTTEERTRLKAEVVGGSAWRLTVEHDKGAHTLRSELTFGARKGTPPRCVITNAAFRSKAEGLAFSADKVPPRECLDFFLATDRPERMKDGLDEVSFAWMRKDCAIALRFVAEPGDLK